MISRRRALAAALVALTYAAARPGAARETIEILDPWARAGLAGRASAAYMTIVNHGAERDELFAAASPVARVVELHTHRMENGVMRMRPVNAIEVNVGEPAVLAPGGLHIMLIDLVRDLRPGETIALTLRFRNGGERTLEVPVLPAGARGPAGHGRHGTPGDRHTH